MAPTVLALDGGTNDVVTGTMLGATVFAIGIGARWVVTVVVLGAIILNHLPPVIVPHIVMIPLYLTIGYKGDKLVHKVWASRVCFFRGGS